MAPGRRRFRRRVGSVHGPPRPHSIAHVLGSVAQHRRAVPDCPPAGCPRRMVGGGPAHRARLAAGDCRIALVACAAAAVVDDQRRAGCRARAPPAAVADGCGAQRRSQLVVRRGRCPDVRRSRGIRSDPYSGAGAGLAGAHGGPPSPHPALVRTGHSCGRTLRAAGGRAGQQGKRPGVACATWCPCRGERGLRLAARPWRAGCQPERLGCGRRDVRICGCRGPGHPGGTARAARPARPPRVVPAGVEAFGSRALSRAARFPHSGAEHPAGDHVRRLRGDCNLAGCRSEPVLARTHRGGRHFP